jgi:hypothetical protein
MWRIGRVVVMKNTCLCGGGVVVWWCGVRNPHGYPYVCNGLLPLD